MMIIILYDDHPIPLKPPCQIFIECTELHMIRTLSCAVSNSNCNVKTIYCIGKAHENICSNFGDSQLAKLKQTHIDYFKASAST